MPVKDLVGLYESRTGTSAPVDPTASPSQRDSSVRNQRRVELDKPKAGPPRVAENVIHPLLRPALPVLQRRTSLLPMDGLPTSGSHPLIGHALTTSDENSEFTNSTTSTTLYDDTHLSNSTHLRDYSGDITDELTTTAKHEAGTLPDLDLVKAAIKPRSKYTSEEEEITSHGPLADASARIGGHKRRHSQPASVSTDTLVPILSQPSHKPVAASVIFSRCAVPLSFPELDRLLSRIHAPLFPTFTKLHAEQGKGPHMFPPMKLLALSGKSLEDLEHNSQIPHWWQNRNKIFGFLVSLVLSITVRISFVVSTA
jgi:hypothetical protein